MFVDLSYYHMGISTFILDYYYECIAGTCEGKERASSGLEDMLFV